jgi:GTP pyrophosphokinase
VGERARETVRLVTKWKPSGEENEEEKEARQQEYYRAISENRDAMIVKVLDRCNNISDMAGAFKYPKMAEYINETEQYVMPLLENLKDFYPELHDAAFLVKYQMRTVLTSLKRILYASASEKTL